MAQVEGVIYFKWNVFAPIDEKDDFAVFSFYFFEITFL
jgi:hypothetical protein